MSKRGKTIVVDGSRQADASLLPAKIAGGSPLTPDYLADSIGGRNEFVNMCRLSEAPEVIEFVRRTMAEGSDVSLEVILDSMNLKLDKILESVVPALVRFGGNVGRLINAVNIAKTMMHSVENAALPGMEGFSDRKLQLDIAGLIPKAGNINIIGQMNLGGIERPEHTLKQVSEVIDVQPETDGKAD